jgi:polysaccharide biosynthesis protein PslG
MFFVKRLVAGLCLIGLLVLFAFLARDSVRQVLSDWTGEEDLETQFRGLGYLALAAIQPAHDTADLTPIKYADVNPFGVNTFLEQEVEEGKVRKTIQMIRDAGFHWIRQEFPWEDIEKPAKGQFWDVKFNHSTWDKYDLLVNVAHEYGLEVIARIDHPPAWTRQDGRARGDFAPPDNYADYGDFVATVVDRYRGKIRFYQLWNEPNVSPEWGEQDVSAPDYVRLLKIGYTRAKATDANAVILSAGLAQTADQRARAMSDLVFLQQMYDAGARGYFDILGAQDYGLYTGPGDRRVEFGRTNFSRPILVREIMVKNGDVDKPIWAMEVGWNTVPVGMTATFGRVSEDQQARYTVQGYERAQDEWPWMGSLMYWFFKRAYDTERDQPFYYFRMLNPDFTPLPVYAAMKDYIAEARAVTPGFRSTTDWAMDWQGGWETRPDYRAYFGEYKIGKPGDSVSFVFRGNDLDLVALQNPYGGAVKVQIDGQPAREMDLWLTDPEVGGRIAVARDLDDSDHHAVITVTRAQVAINGFILQRTNTWWVRVAGLVALALGLVLVGIVWTRRAR